MKIFKSFEYDFTQSRSLIDFLNLYLTKPLGNDTPIKYRRYDWSLNQL